MRVVLQRVANGRVSVDDQVVAEIGPGLVILLGVGPEDGESEIRYLVQKIANLRIFEDDDGKIIAAWDVPTYFLTQCKSVEEVKATIPGVKVVMQLWRIMGVDAPIEFH